MLKNFIFFVFVIFIFTGCSSTQQPSNLNKMQIKMARIERNIDENNKQIKEIKYIVNELSSQVDGLETYQDAEPVVEVNDVKSKDNVKNIPVSRSTKSKTKAVSKKHRGIIRVSVSTKIVQQALSNAGYYNGSLDGKIGNKTKNAIKDFQRDHDLTADGIIGVKTWNQMKDYLE